MHVPGGSELGGAAPCRACVPTSAPGDGDPLPGKGLRPPLWVTKALETFVMHLLLIASHILRTLPEDLPSLVAKTAAISRG